MSEKMQTVQPSNDFHATCVAIAWSIVSTANVAGEKDVLKLAAKVREASLIIAGKPLSPQ